MFLAAIIFIIILHWIADFVLQSHWMSTNKSSSWVALSAHVGVYTLSLAIGILTFFAFYFGTLQVEFALKWAAINGVLHFITDAITSRITKYYWQKGDIHNFFVMVGLDQAIHMICLITLFVVVMFTI